MYAILDIETTGGKYNEEGITEIAIYRFDGHEIVDQFSSLINPERPIQPFVANLTGINNEMLKRAPKFYEVAKRIIEITSNCILVAHNALFDARILATEFDRLGYTFERETLCTVELAKRLLPDMPSYSLSKLVKHLGIPLTNPHRAQGDAKATVSLFKILLAKDNNKEIISSSLRKEAKQELKPKHLELIESAPTDIGVYYLYNSSNRLIYIGKGKNIKKKLTQHFTYTNNKSKRLQEEVASVAFEKTGNELITLIKETEEIVKTKPLYNSKLGQKLYNYQLVSTVNDDGYIILKIEKADGRKKALFTFNNYNQAKSLLKELIEEYDLIEKQNGSKSSPKEPAKEYNQRVRKMLSEKSLSGKNLLVIDKGRDTEERSLIWIEKGRVKGYAFYSLNYQITNPEILQNIITPVKDAKNTTHIVQNYLRKNRVLKIVELPS